MISSRTLLLAFTLVNYTSAQFYIEYHESAARKLLAASAAAYSNDPSRCFHNMFPFEDYRVILNQEVLCDKKGNTCSVFVAISHTKRNLIVSFRGTNSGKQLKREMIESLKPEVEWYGFGLVDRYFYEAHNKLWPYIEPTLSNALYFDYRIQFTGHSLGGALAALAVLKTHKKNYRTPEMLELYTFGEPRVGNIAFANNIDRVVANSWRVVNAGDIVPHLPPCRNDPKNRKACDKKDQRRGYHHGTEIWYPKGMSMGSSYKICTHDDEDASCSNSLGKWDINDHYYYFNMQVSGYGIAGCDLSFINHANFMNFNILFILSVALLL